jgi:hypothetical protein
MTLLGKVLVFVNLFFSLAVAFFITQSYAKRTDWARAYKDADGALKQAEASRNQYMEQAQKAITEGNTKVAAVQGNLEKALQEKAAFQAKVNDLMGQIAKKDDTLNKMGLGTTGQQNEVQRLTQQAEGLQKMLADANKRLDDQAKNVEDFRQRAVKAEIDNRSLSSRNNELLAVIEGLEKDIIRIKNGPGAGGATTTQTALTANPPPGDVSGRVKNFDPTSGLMTITIGSDAGILKGHTLQVYRLEPNGQYVGVMRVLEVRPNEAVGKMINKPRTPVQVNDKVASKIS